MSDVNHLRHVLGQTSEHSGSVIAGLVEAQRELGQLLEVLANVTSGTNNDEIQQAVAAYAQAKDNIQDNVINLLVTANEHVMNYWRQL